MITLLDGFAQDVVAVRAEGQVSRQDYDAVLIPAVEKALTRNDRVKFYYEFGPDFTGMDLGAMMEDMRVGLGHLRQWACIAVVTDVDWIKRAVDLFKFLLPAPTKTFSLAQAADAKAWIAHEHID
jgi:hypothetical protein